MRADPVGHELTGHDDVERTAVRIEIAESGRLQPAVECACAKVTAKSCPDRVPGGLERGTSALLIGGAGVGKSTIALTYAAAAAGRGEHAAIFAFDEGLGTIYARAAGLGIPLQQHVKAGRIELQQVDPAEMSPGEFAHLVRHSVERNQARLVVIDSLNGYLNAMP